MINLHCFVICDQPMPFKITHKDVQYVCLLSHARRFQKGSARLTDPVEDINILDFKM